MIHFAYICHRQWLESYLDALEFQNKSPLTCESYYRDLSKFILWFEQVYKDKISNANSTVIDHYLKFLKNGLHAAPAPLSFWAKIWSFFWRFKRPQKTLIRGALKPSSARRHLSSIKNFYDYLIQAYEDDKKMIRQNPVKNKLHSIRLKEVQIEHTVMLRPKDWQRLCDWIHRPQEKLILYLLYYAGLRLDELSKLTKDDFDHAGGVLKLKRKGGYRHTLLPQKRHEIFGALEKHLGTRKKHGPRLFPYSNRTMYNLIKRMLAKAGCQTQGLSPHSFRKACATNLYLKTKDLLFVRDYLNHKDAQVTQTYIDPSILQEDQMANYALL